MQKKSCHQSAQHSTMGEAPGTPMGEKPADFFLAIFARGGQDFQHEPRGDVCGCSLEEWVENLPCHARA